MVTVTRGMTNKNLRHIRPFELGMIEYSRMQCDAYGPMLFFAVLLRTISRFTTVHMVRCCFRVKLHQMKCVFSRPVSMV